jgi:ABC-2 type transport system ATP-binding protein
VEDISPPLLNINGLVKKYGERVAVQGVSFSIEEGENFGLLGPNGARKTTTLSLLSTLLIPDEGNVTICGYDLIREARRTKRLIGYVPQEGALYPTLNARDNLSFFGHIYGLQGAGLKERITAVLALVGLSDRAGDPVSQPVFLHQIDPVDDGRNCLT